MLPVTMLRLVPVLLLALVATFGPVLPGGAVYGQQVYERGSDLADRPLSAIRIAGASTDAERMIRNNIRAAVGDPYLAETVRSDVERIHNLGRFRFVTAEVELQPDGSVAVIYTVAPQPLIAEVQVVGNSAISDQDLLDAVRIMRGGPRDDFLIQKAKRDIEALYRKKGYFLTTVELDESALEDRGLLIFRIIEGPRVRIKVIEFEGNDAFRDELLLPEVKTRTHIFLFRRGALDTEVLADDVAALDRFYKSRGYLDVRVDRTVSLSPDNREAKVTFLIREGPQYRLGAVRTENRLDPDQPLKVFSDEQIAAILEIKPGDVYSRDKLRRSLDMLETAYGVMGYIDVRLLPSELRRGPEPVVDLLLEIEEGEPSMVGVINISGNFLTRDKVVRRLLRVEPGRPYNSADLAESERRIQRSRLFNDVRVTVQERDELDPEYRDLLVEVKERNTGSIGFGVAVGSDAGVFGELSVRQDNFDVADWPESFQEYFAGRSFRGAGQRFSMVFRPGNEIFQYSMSLTEPHLLDTDYSGSVAGSFRQRVYNQYDEERLTGSLSLGRQLGDIWEVSLRTRAERVRLTSIAPEAPTEIYLDQGPDTLTALGVSLTRTTIGTLTRPGRGTRLELSLDKAGAFGGDVDFWRTEADYTIFLTLDEDFLGRKSVLKFNGRIGYIFGDRAPTYERFYLGGRSFRGFEFRTVSPKGVRNDNGQPSSEPVGGDWLLFLGTQYEFPLFQETVTGVVFVDSGTVTDDVGFDDYRVSAGFGFRLYIQQLGPVPIAFDFGFPIVQEETDEEQVISFSAELPF